MKKGAALVFCIFATNFLGNGINDSKLSKRPIPNENGLNASTARGKQAVLLTAFFLPNIRRMN
jgi:hypothetical protein